MASRAAKGMTLISVHGNSRVFLPLHLQPLILALLGARRRLYLGLRNGAASSSAGFTLLEMLVVLVIAALLISAASLTISRNPRTDLFEEGQRLALLFESAADEAQLRARPILWQPAHDGYTFLIREKGDWRPLRAALFAPRRWQTVVNMVTIRHPGAQDIAERVIFGAESIDMPVTVTLYANAMQISITGNGDGRYTVHK